MRLSFSEQMFAHSDKVSTATVASNTNSPGDNGAFKLDNNTCGKIENILNNLICKDETADVDFEQKIDVEKSKVYKNEIKYDDDYYTDSSEDWTDESESDVEYPAEFVSSEQHQPKKVDDHDVQIIDLPQFILVFTAFKAKDTVIIPPNDLLPEYVQVGSECQSTRSHNSKFSDEKLKNREIIKKHKALINRKSQKNEVPAKTTDLVSAPKHVHRIEYVRYSSSMDVVHREREIQVPSKERITIDASVQCELDGETVPTAEDSSQLEWINHIIEAHVLNEDSDMYECHICGEIALSYASKEKHSLIHKEGSLLCFQCGLHFRTAIKLKCHEKTAHQGKAFEIKKALRCPKLYCTKAFHSKKQLFKHIDGHAKKTEQRCSKCQRSFNSLFQYHIHKSKRNCWR